MQSAPQEDRPATSRTDRLLSDLGGFIVRAWDDVKRFMSGSIGPTAFSRAAAGDPNLDRQIRERRRRLTLGMARRLKQLRRRTAAQRTMAADLARAIRPVKTPVPGKEICR